MTASRILHRLPRFAAVVAFAVLAAVAQDASADDADKAACIDMDEGEACVRGDGDAGTCVADESDSHVLTCEDSVGDDGGNSSASSAGSSGGDDGSCSIGARSLGAPGLALVLLGLRRRRS